MLSSLAGWCWQVLVLNEAGQDVPKFLKSMAARGPMPHGGGVGLGKPKASDREVDNFGAAEEEASATQEDSFGDEECEKLTTSV